MRTQMDSPLLEKENSKSSNQRSRFSLFLVCVLFVSAGVLYARDVPYVPKDLPEDPVGVAWADIKIKTCVDISKSCMGQFVSEQQTWRELVDEDGDKWQKAQPHRHQRADLGEEADVGTMRKLLTSSETASNTKLNTVTKTDTAASDMTDQDTSASGASTFYSSSSESFGLFEMMRGIGIVDHHDRGSKTHLPGDALIPGNELKRVPYICEITNVEHLNCKIDGKLKKDAPAGENDKDVIGKGGFAQVILTSYKENQLKLSQFASPDIKYSHPVVLKRQDQKQLTGDTQKREQSAWYLEGIISQAIYQRVPGLAVEVLDVYEGSVGLSSEPLKNFASAELKEMAQQEALDGPRMYMATNPVACGDLGVIPIIKLFRRDKKHTNTVYYAASLGVTFLDMLILLHDTAGFVHRDIKPQNILWGVHYYEMVMLFGDVGSAWPVASDDRPMQPENGGTTRSWRGPSLCTGLKNEADVNYEANDVWAAMATLFYIYYDITLFVPMAVHKDKTDAAVCTWMTETYIPAADPVAHIKTILKDKGYSGEDPMQIFFQYVLHPDVSRREDKAALRTRLQSIIQKYKNDEAVGLIQQRFKTAFSKKMKKFGIHANEVEIYDPARAPRKPPTLETGVGSATLREFAPEFHKGLPFPQINADSSDELTWIGNH